MRLLAAERQGQRARNTEEREIGYGAGSYPNARLYTAAPAILSDQKSMWGLKVRWVDTGQKTDRLT